MQRPPAAVDGDGEMPIPTVEPRSRPALIRRSSLAAIADESDARRLLRLVDPDRTLDDVLVAALASGDLVLVLPEDTEPLDPPCAEGAPWLSELRGRTP